VAKALFVRRDQQAAMQAFMSGQIKVQGDMTKLMAMSSTVPTPEQEAFAQKVLDLTEA
jgi:putative sterol carrier protein